MKEDELQHKLFHFEAEPPAKLWNKIAESLDGEITQEFPERLFHFQSQPPAHIWEQIESELNAPKVIPLTKRYPKVYRYGSVAAILFGAALCINLFLNKKSSGETNGSVITEQNISTSTLPNNDEATQNNNSSPLLSQTTTDVATTTRAKRRKATRLKPLPADDRPVAFSQTANVIVPKDLPVVQSDIPDRYIVFSKATGEAVRLSKKLFSLFACSDKFEDCRQDIESAQQRMASPTMMASTDFNGVLDLLQNMNTQ